MLALPTVIGWLLQQPGLGFTAVMGMAVVCATAGLVVALIGPLRRISASDQWSNPSCECSERILRARMSVRNVLIRQPDGHTPAD